MATLSGDASLLEALTRPDGSLVDHHVQETLRFVSEHSRKLAAVEAALGASTVADGPVRALRLWCGVVVRVEERPGRRS